MRTVSSVVAIIFFYLNVGQIAIAQHANDDTRVGMRLTCPSDPKGKPEASVFLGKLASVFIGTVFDYAGTLLAEAGKGGKSPELVAIGSGNWYEFDALAKGGGGRPIGCIWIARGTFGKVDTPLLGEEAVSEREATAYKTLGILRRPAFYVELKVSQHVSENLFRLAPNMLVFQRSNKSSWSQERGLTIAMSFYEKATSPTAGQPYASTILQFDKLNIGTILLPDELRFRETEWLNGLPGGSEPSKDANGNVLQRAFGPVSVKAVVYDTSPSSVFLTTLASQFSGAKDDLVSAARSALIPAEREKLASNERATRYQLITKMADARYQVEIKELELQAIPADQLIPRKQKELELTKAKISANELYESAGLGRPYAMQ